MLIHIADRLQVGLAGHGGHGDVGVDHHGVLLVAHDVQHVGGVVPDADEDGPGAVGHLEDLLRVGSVLSIEREEKKEKHDTMSINWKIS